MEAGGWVSQLLQLVDTIPLHIPCLRCRILNCLPAISNLAPGVNKRLFACWLFHRWSPCFPFGKSNCCPSLPSTDVRSIGSKQGEETEQPYWEPYWGVLCFLILDFRGVITCGICLIFVQARKSTPWQSRNWMKVKVMPQSPSENPSDLAILMKGHVWLLSELSLIFACPFTGLLREHHIV